MSKTQHLNATLEGYEGPFFPDTVDELRTALDHSPGGNTGIWLNGVAKTARGEATRQFRTEDGYLWFWGVEKHGSDVVILIPWSQDWGKKDGTQADRSIALYYRGGTETEAVEFLRHFTNAVRAQVGTYDFEEAARSHPQPN